MTDSVLPSLPENWERALAVVAHPDSPKPALQWRTWNVPYDGIDIGSMRVVSRAMLWCEPAPENGVPYQGAARLALELTWQWADNKRHTR